jgi:hypothetical protein
VADSIIEPTWQMKQPGIEPIAGQSVYSLMARDFAPMEQRLTSAAARLEKLPKFLNQARGERSL